MAERCVVEFNAKDLANTAWAFAKAGQPDAPLFMALARMAERRVVEFNGQALVNTAWAFSVANVYSTLLFGPVFVHRVETMVGTDFESLGQLHQWVLWHQEL